MLDAGLSALGGRKVPLETLTLCVWNSAVRKVVRMKILGKLTRAACFT